MTLVSLSCRGDASRVRWAMPEAAGQGVEKCVKGHLNCCHELGNTEIVRGHSQTL
jgi:hypothetical protein